MGTLKQYRFKLAWQNYRVGAVIEPSGMVRDWLLQNGYIEPVADPIVSPAAQFVTEPPAQPVPEPVTERPAQPVFTRKRERESYRDSRSER